MDFKFHYRNLAKHSVSPEEVEECFADTRKLVRAGSGAYWLVAKTEAGRLLEIGFAKEPDDSAYIFHAMDAKSHQRKQYRKRGK